MKNNNFYNDKELFDDADLNWYGYGFRNYDAQIGRFTQLDPLTDDYPYCTPYQIAGNEPISNTDLDGLDPLDALSAIPTGAMVAEKSLAPVVVMGLSQAAKSSGSFFSAVGNFLSKAGSSFVNGAKGFIKEMNRRAKINIAKDIEWIKSTAKQLEANRKANWASGNNLIQQLPKDFMENPLEFLEGGAELNMLKGVGIESEELSSLIKTENAVNLGWKVGEPITNLTIKGNIPVWSTVRQRFWKNEVFFNSSAYTKENILRMRKGLAPQIRNPTTGLMESMELHHTPPQREGGLFKFKIVTPEQHLLIDPFRRIKK